uniref:EGF-like domain-containing protein n=1 Tax=Onchocerca volvulus TaxID=6282 RepID=A0A8R1TKX9_ONCVO
MDSFRMWPLFHFGIHLFLFVKLTSQINKGTDCTDPYELSLFFKNDPIMCIYGIKFTGGFDSVLYYNNPSKFQNVTEQLDEAGMFLCKSASIGYRDRFQEVTIPITDKKYIDLFITCCSKCPYVNATDWLIHLKSQFLIHHYAIVKTFGKLKEYEMAPRVLAILPPSICETEIYQEIPATGNNDVCFTYGQQKFLNPVAGEKYPLELETLLRMGYYNSTAAEYPLGNHCTMNYNSWFENKSEDSCLFGLNRTGFKYFCCCYGFDFKGCQELPANLLRKDRYITDELFCAMKELVIEKNKSKEENKLTSFVVPIEHMIGVIKGSSKNMACHMRLMNNNAINFEGDENLCIQSAALDIRLRPIITTVCITLKDHYRTPCPLQTPNVTEQLDIACCCNHQHFCNYNASSLSYSLTHPDIQFKIAAESSDRRKCFYNDKYQYLFNQYYVRTRDDDMCLLHYIDSITISDMIGTSSNDGSVYHSYPGNGFHPIDFSYIFLENNTCAYVEVEISRNFIRKSGDCFDRLFNTDYMPVKLFVCSCSLKKNSNHCDRELEKDIANRAKKFPNESLTKCIKFDKMNKMLLNKSELIYVRHTSYCFVQARMEIRTTSDIKFEIKADAMTRLMAEHARRHLNHIAYSMYSFAVCFCRSYNPNATACNENPKMLLNAINLLMSEKNRLTRRELVRHWLNLKQKLQCHSGPFYATISINYGKRQILRRTKCASKQIDLLKSDRSYRVKRFDNSIFCDALSLFGRMAGCFILNSDFEESEKLRENQISNVFRAFSNFVTRKDVNSHFKDQKWYNLTRRYAVCTMKYHIWPFIDRKRSGCK